MPIGPDFTTAAREEQHQEINDLLIAAFGRPDEAALVDRLRADGDMWCELVKPWQGVIAGYAALARMRSPEGWACLAPLAVLPRFQRSSAAPTSDLKRYYAVGTRLAQEITIAAQMSHTLRAADGQPLPATVVVVGRPIFYERAGFSWARAQQLLAPYPLANTLIARPGDDAPTERLIYPPAFKMLD